MSVIQTEIVVLGSGPGGYTAAFRAADLGKQVVLIERDPTLGGVCLNVGCIPSKALLHAVKVIDDVHEMAGKGINFAPPQIDINELRTWKESVIKRLTGGLTMLAKQRKVQVVNGEGKFTSANEIVVETAEGKTTIQFQNAIIAAGSRPTVLPGLPNDPRVIDSTGALELQDIPERMLIVGGGIIGMEMASVYHGLGSKITVVELGDDILTGFDKDVITPLRKHVQKRYENILLKTKVSKFEAKTDGIYATFEGDNAPEGEQRFDKVLVCVGRVPNGKLIDADKAGVEVNERGFIPVDKQQRTNVAHIFAIGDIAGNPMLAHKAIPEGRIAAEVIAGYNHFFDVACIPSVCYTDPEVAWVGLTEKEAKAQGLNVGTGIFPWAASGRSLSMTRSEGLTKVVFDKDSHRLLGAAMVGPFAGELVGEVALAIEMGCVAEDIALTIHPHPTLSETFVMATEVFEGTITDLYLPKK